MQLRSITIQGFRSFAAQSEIDFTAMRPGLYHVTGRNLVEPELEGNGAGKSSLFESVFWTAYGRTSRGLRAGAVQNWHSKERCAGILNVTGPAGPLAVLRVWQPNTLEVSQAEGEPRPVDEAELTKLLGMSAETMLYAMYFAQFTKSFVDLKPAEQTELFTDVLGLHVWEDAAARASAAAGEARRWVEKYTAEIANVEGQLEELLRQDAQTRADSWEEDQSQIIQSVLAEVDELQAWEKLATKALVAAEKGVQAVRAKQAVLTTRQDACVAAKAVVFARERDLEMARRTVNASPNVCRVCGQTIKTKDARKHTEKEIATITALWEEAQAEWDKVSDEHDAAVRAVLSHTAELDAYAEKTKDLNEVRAALANNAAILARLRAEVNPHDAAAAQAEHRGEQLVTALEEHQAALQRIEREAAAAEFWVKGFKEVRLVQIRESLAQLEIEANEELYKLGLRDWSLHFDVERETKSGGINNKFSVEVQAPHVKGVVPWEAWSGGESQRLRLAASMGFANLVCARAGVQPNVEFWDEPSQWLSQAGINDLLQVLAARAERLQKIILLADHRSLDFGGFTGSVQLLKDKNGTHIG